MEALKILVVDDEPRMRKLVKDFLTVKGFQVIEAEDGEQAIDIFFEEKDIALILLDVMMPKMDGWEVLKTPVFSDSDFNADRQRRRTGRASGI